VKISGKTKIVALLGYPVEHTLSPDMHNAAFEHLGLDYCYVAFPVRPEMLKSALEAVRALGLAGVNVTVPHKEKVIPLLDEADSEAAFIGAVNTVVNRDDRLIGYNTDGRGFMRGLAEEGVSVKDRSVLIIGAGGGSRAISYYLSEQTSRLLLFDIDTDKAERLAADLGKIRDNVSCLKALKDLGGIDILINATPLGLKPSDPLPVDVSMLNTGHIVGDLIYKETPLLRKASKKGLKIFNGLGMLLWQGALALELWTGKTPPHEVMREALMRGLRGA
jgi:shikimate dehydrogenase